MRAADNIGEWVEGFLVKATIPLPLACLGIQLYCCLVAGTLFAQLRPGRASSKLCATLLLNEELAIGARIIWTGTDNMVLLCDAARNTVVRLNGLQA